MRRFIYNTISEDLVQLEIVIDKSLPNIHDATQSFIEFL